MSIAEFSPSPPPVAGTGRVRRTIGRTLAVVVLALAVLADTLAFNQLATQSAIDGMIQLSVLGVGATGALLALTLLFLPDPRGERALVPVSAALAVVSFIGWRAQWPIGWAVLGCAASAAVWLVLGLRSTAWARVGPVDPRFVAVATTTQGLIFLWFAALVAIDARQVLFG